MTERASHLTCAAHARRAVVSASPPGSVCSACSLNCSWSIENSDGAAMRQDPARGGGIGQGMLVQALGYVGVSAADLADWRTYGTRHLGLQVVDRAEGSVAFRMDDRSQRLIVE